MRAKYLCVQLPAGQRATAGSASWCEKGGRGRQGLPTLRWPWPLCSSARLACACLLGLRALQWPFPPRIFQPCPSSCMADPGQVPGNSPQGRLALTPASICSLLFSMHAVSPSRCSPGHLRAHIWRERDLRPQVLLGEFPQGSFRLPARDAPSFPSCPRDTLLFSLLQFFADGLYEHTAGQRAVLKFPLDAIRCAIEEAEQKVRI